SANTGTQASTDTAAAAVSTCSFLLACIPITYLLKIKLLQIYYIYYGVMLSSLRFDVKKKMVTNSATILLFLSRKHPPLQFLNSPSRKTKRNLRSLFHHTVYPDFSSMRPHNTLTECQSQSVMYSRLFRGEIR